MSRKQKSASGSCCILMNYWNRGVVCLLICFCFLTDHEQKDWEIYRDTCILGGYMPECAKLRQTENGEVATVFRDTTTRVEEDCITKQREMLIGGRRFCITSVFPAEPSATPTDKLIACIDAELEKEAHSA